MPSALPALSRNAALLLTLTTLFWGGNAVAGKFAVGHISPLLLTAARWGLASLILIVLAHRHLLSDWPVIAARLPYLFAMGALGFAVFNGFFYTALLYTTAINATIIQAGMPMFIFILGFLFFRSRTSLGQAVGYSLTLCGVAVAALRGEFGRIGDYQINRGDLIMLAAAVIYAAYSVALQAKPKIHWLSFLAVLVTAAAVMAVPMALYEATTDAFIWPATVTGWSVVAYTAIFPSILAQGFYIRGVELLGGNKSALFLNLVPIFGALLSVVLLDERFLLFHGVALGLVIAGIVLAQRLKTS
jgi:drug/metabolite transporter (DMT)-like permease